MLEMGVGALKPSDDRNRIKAVIDNVLADREPATAWSMVRSRLQVIRATLPPDFLSCSLQLAALRLVGRGVDQGQIAGVLRRSNLKGVVTAFEAAFKELEGVNERRDQRKQLLREIAVKVLGVKQSGILAQQELAHVGRYELDPEGRRLEITQAWERAGASEFLRPTLDRDALARDTQIYRRTLQSEGTKLRKTDDCLRAAQALKDGQSLGLTALPEFQDICRQVIAVALKTNQSPEVRSQVAEIFLEMKGLLTPQTNVRLADLCRKAKLYPQAIELAEEQVKVPENKVLATLLLAQCLTEQARTDESLIESARQRIRTAFVGYVIDQSHPEYLRYVCYRVFSGMCALGSPEAQRHVSYLQGIQKRYSAQGKNHQHVARALELLLDFSKRDNHRFLFS